MRDVIVFSGVLAVLALAIIALGARRPTAGQQGTKLYEQVIALYRNGHDTEVMGLRFPTSPTGDLGRMWQGLSANRLLQFETAHDLLCRPSLDGLGSIAPHLEPLITLARANMFLGLGRYAEAAAFVEPLTPQSPLWAIRARAAIELGEVEVAQLMLGYSRQEPVERVVSQLMLGDLTMRGGDIESAEHLARTARLQLTEEQGTTHSTLVAKCLLLEADARLQAGDPHQALELAQQAAQQAEKSDHDARVPVRCHLLLAIIFAELGDRHEAEEQLMSARSLVARCQSPPLVVALSRATGIVSLHLGDLDAARHHLDQAITGYEQLGARPAADRLRSRLAALDC